MDADPTQSATPDTGDRRDAARRSDQPPADVPGYDIQRLLGTGAYGEVWVAADRNTGRQVAIKFFAHRGGVDWGLVSREVEKLVFLSADRYVVQLLEVGWESDPAYFVMEYVENGSLDDLLRVEGSLSVAQAVEIFRELAIGLARAHGKGVLHCDLKPANILLDQDHKPRLADFGQSRLVSEQSPALGTLFYMAPEQADMQAVPDARWDVYGLGALFYCLLTGAPPYRTDDGVARLNATKNLEDRLRIYRDVIDRSDPPRGHYDLPGMDRSLAEIIDRCLAKRHEDRFQHLPAILESLRHRDVMRFRRPLLLLGIVGPILLLLTMSIFGYRGYKQAMRESEAVVTERAMEGNRFAAALVSDNVAYSIERRYRAVADAASVTEVRQYIQLLQADQECREYLESVKHPANAAPEASAEQTSASDQARQAFISHIARQPLQEFVQQRLDDRSLESASWFVTDAHGTFLAAAFHGQLEDIPVGRNFAYRSYFHGGPTDLPADSRPSCTLTGPRLSSVFRSTSTATWKIAISAPILQDGELMGVVAMTATLGDFHDFPRSNNRFAVVVDGRDGPLRGVILEHPMLDDGAAQFNFSRYKADVDLLKASDKLVYRDPIADTPVGAAYRGRWIAGTSRIQVNGLGSNHGGDSSGEAQDTGLLVVVQERLDAAIDPVAVLGRRLVREALLATGFVVTVSLSLWYLVARSFADSKRAMNSRATGDNRSSTLHSRETLTQPMGAKKMGGLPRRQELD